MKFKIMLTIVFLTAIFLFNSARPALAVTLEEMIPEIKCPEDNETLEHQHGCEIHKRMLTLLEKLIKEGKTKDEILDIFAQQFGPGALVTVRDVGFGRLARLIPRIVLIIAVILVVAFIGKWIKITEEKEKISTSEVSDDKYNKKFEEEYKAFKEKSL
ncbi:cytochrome c-type biogenesis protein CcmH [Candidatus Poribacteria bacterium]|nr:cytochrome c-type biogenesis protein CcmH [Candidatus Poribacteria bacterium]